MVLLSNAHDEVVQAFAQLCTSLRIQNSDRGDAEVALSHYQLCVVQYYTPVGEKSCKRGTATLAILKKAKTRLTSPLNQRIQLRCVTVATENGPVWDVPHACGGIPVF
jgi:hypothetical protein